MIISKEKYWKEVRKEEFKDNLFRIYLDETCLQSDQGNDIMISERLADEIVREWSVDGKIDSIKNSFFTKFCFSATDCTEKERVAVLDRLVEYGNCDPICYIASEPTKLHLKQKTLYRPLIEWAEKLLSIKLKTGSSLLFIEQPLLNSSKIKNYLEDLDNFHLTALHELTKSLGSLFTSLALYRKFVSPERAWEVANAEDNFRIEVWGEVEEETLIKNANLEFFNNLVKILSMI